MEQRVRDIIESLQKFDRDIRVSENTTLNFKYDGYATRLVVECKNLKESARIKDLEDKLENVEEILESRVDDIDGHLKTIDELEMKVIELESNLRECHKSLEIIRGTL